MVQYIGTKIIRAEPMDHGHAMAVKIGVKAEECSNTLKGMTEEGYLVVYPDGYKSWSPKAAFEEAYRPTDGMSFGLAIEAMKKGLKVSRKGWNGKGMYVFLASDVEFTTAADMSEFYDYGNEEGKEVEVSDMLVLRTAQATLQPGWLATQSDMLADDWMLV